MRELAVSRSIGDPDYKRFIPHEKVEALFNWPEDHNQSFAADLVIPDPEVVTFELNKNDEFFVIASDGQTWLGLMMQWTKLEVLSRLAEALWMRQRTYAISH